MPIRRLTAENRRVISGGRLVKVDTAVGSCVCCGPGVGVDCTHCLPGITPAQLRVTLGGITMWGGNACVNIQHPHAASGVAASFEPNTTTLAGTFDLTQDPLNPCLYRGEFPVITGDHFYNDPILPFSGNGYGCNPTFDQGGFTYTIIIEVTIGATSISVDVDGYFSNHPDANGGGPTDYTSGDGVNNAARFSFTLTACDDPHGPDDSSLNVDWVNDGSIPQDHGKGGTCSITPI